jgi:hypothetical protein
MNRLNIVCGLTVACAFAVAAGAETKAAETKKEGTKTLTGCLQKGTEAGTFTLTNVTGGPAATNKDWELMDIPASLKMDEHVGHKVSVTGSVVGVGAAAKMEGEATSTTPAGGTGKTDTTKTGMSDEAMHRHLKVSSMKHIAATCP